MQQTRLTGLANRQLRQATNMRRVLCGMPVVCPRGAHHLGRVQYSTTVTRASAVAEVSADPEPVAEPSVQPPTPTKLLPGEADGTRFQQVC